MRISTKFIAFFLIYVLIGVAVTKHRARVERWSQGGPGSIVAYLVYPFAYPVFEAMRFVDMLEERRFREEFRGRRVDAACPPAYAKLLRESALSARAEPQGADYDEFLNVLREQGLERNDPRAGFVLQQLCLAATVSGDLERVRADAEDFLSRANEEDPSPLWIAAALLCAAHDMTSGDATVARTAFNVYRKAYDAQGPAERPYGAFALATACEAADALDAARAHYAEAITSGRVALGMRALVRAAPLAADDEERAALLNAFFNAIDFPNREDKISESPDEVLLRGVDVQLLSFSNRNDLVMLTLGRHLFPLRATRRSGVRFDRFLEEGLRGGSELTRMDMWWEDFAVALEPSFSTFRAKLAMVERILDETMDLGRYSGYLDLRRITTTWVRETYYRLYSETEDERWLEEAPASQIRLRPNLAPYETYLQSEVAFMLGAYRKQIDLAVEAMLTNEDTYPLLPESWGYLRGRMDRMRVYAAEESELYHRVMDGYLWEIRDILDEGKDDGLTAEELLRRYREGEVAPPFHDFRDEDVREGD